MRIKLILLVNVIFLLFALSAFGQNASRQGVTDFALAIANNDEAKVAELAAQGEVQRWNEAMTIPVLTFAIEKSNSKILLILIDAGAPVNVQSTEQALGPLAYALATKKWEVARLLVDRGAKVGFDQSALSRAIVREAEASIGAEMPELFARDPL